MSNQVRMSLFGRILAVIFLSATSTSFAWGQSDKTAPPEKASVWWVDAETGKTLFTNLDIIRFDWERQIFELTRERAMDLMSLPFGLETNFVVRDTEGEIYRGCYGSPSASPFWKPCGPAILAGFWPGAPRPPLYQIAESSHGGYYSSFTKHRFNPRLKDRLQAAGALSSIANDEKVMPIEGSFYGSYNEAFKRSASVLLFPETVRIGRNIRLLLLFAELRKPGDRSFPPVPEQVEARIALRSEDGKSERIKTFAVPVESLTKAFSNTLPLAIWPWSESGQSVDTRFEPGPAELGITLVATIKAFGGAEQVGEWKILAIKLQILPGPD